MALEDLGMAGMEGQVDLDPAGMENPADLGLADLAPVDLDPAGPVDLDLEDPDALVGAAAHGVSLCLVI